MYVVYIYVTFSWVRILYIRIKVFALIFATKQLFVVIKSTIRLT